MKAGLTAVLLGVSLLPGFAQDKATTETPKPAMELSAQEQAKQEKEKADARRRAQKAMEQPGVTYGGFFADLSKAESKTAALSLRQPMNPVADMKNLVYYDERSQRPKGFILFSWDF